MDQWVGTLSKIIHYNSETNYLVGKLDLDGGESMTMAGNAIGNHHEGMRARVHGTVMYHRVYGEQIKISLIEPVAPTNAEEIRQYLATGQIKGIGSVTANRIVDHFGAETLTVLDTNIDALLQVPKVGPKTVDRIRQSWEETRETRDMMLPLAAAGVSPALAKRIMDHFKGLTVTVLKEEPYRLLEISGIPWNVVDRVGQACPGMTPNSPERLRAALIHAAKAVYKNGDCFVPLSELRDAAIKLLSQPGRQWERHVGSLREAYTWLVEDGQLVPDPGWTGDASALPTYHYRMYEAEIDIAEKLVEIAHAPDSDMALELKKLSDEEWVGCLTSTDIKPTAEQISAVRYALTQPVSVITGGPGCGKSWTVERITSMVRRYGYSAELVAPTGKAAIRLTELTGGCRARTIHMALASVGADADADSDDVGEGSITSADVLIVDEASMVDVWLARRFLSHVSSGTHVVLVGDTDQLPSVGPGTVLADIISSGIAPVTRLSTIFRQAKQSGITVAAHVINSGKSPWHIEQYPDLVRREHGADPVAQIVDLVARDLPRMYGVKPHHIQVLTPQRDSECGVNALNTRLQETLNPASPGREEWEHNNRVFRVGDRVMHIKNNYDLGIYNGTVGLVDRIFVDEDEKKALTITTDTGDVVTYHHETLKELVLSYAMTVHKSQGSEYPVVVLAAVPESQFMLRRNLVYTAITRARKAVAVLSDARMMASAAARIDAGKRRTGLVERFATSVA